MPCNSAAVASSTVGNHHGKGSTADKAEVPPSVTSHSEARRTKKKRASASIRASEARALSFAVAAVESMRVSSMVTLLAMKSVTSTLCSRIRGRRVKSFPVPWYAVPVGVVESSFPKMWMPSVSQSSLSPVKTVHFVRGRGGESGCRTLPGRAGALHLGGGWPSPPGLGGFHLG